MGQCVSKDDNGSGSDTESLMCMARSRSFEKMQPRIVMNKYKMFMDKSSFMGEGTSSICRKGLNTSTGEWLAIKVYKDQSSKKSSKVNSEVLQKFLRQIQVLQELEKPFQKPRDSTLWHKTLDSVEPSQVFMRLIDYSKDANGKPGPDPRDNTIYVVTELAQHSLKDMFETLHKKGKRLPREKVKRLCKAIIVAVASLHVKGFVHIDMKPENLMIFNGRLKVIDVDGCVKMNTELDVEDSTISFSPCYCAPEWARFLLGENTETMLALPGLDVWSVGMTLCELITRDPIMHRPFGNFMRNAHSSKKATFLFMEWLGHIKSAPVPKKVGEHDKVFLDLISNWLLVCQEDQRKSCAQCLSHEFIADAEWDIKVAEKIVREGRPPKQEDQTTGAPLHKGVLFKLNSNSDPSKADHWIRRDMWIAQNHSLCYFSQKENKKLVLIDGSRLAMASFETMNAARPFAFRCMVSEDKENGVYALAAESDKEMGDWIANIKCVGRQQKQVTFRLGEELAADLHAFKMTVKNRRQKVANNSKDQFEPVFKAKLWKLKGDGNDMMEEDWFEREMWIAKNGSLVYFSPKEHMDLVYYTAADIHRATVVAMERGKASKPFTFQVQLPPVDGVDFAPGEFAAESEEMRTKWIAELRKHSNS